MGLVGEERELEVRSESTLLSGKVGPGEVGADGREGGQVSIGERADV